MKWAYRGNFQPDLPAGVQAWSTETHIAEALERNGHEVVRVQEDRASWDETIAAAESCDVFVWTSTLGMAHRWPQDEAHAAVDKLNGMLPTVAYHLDLFFGLDRDRQPFDEPWFKLGLVVTADGGHDERWAEAGVNHRWLPPAVSLAECERAAGPRSHLAPRVAVAFVGSWESYHPEWLPYRQQLVAYLSRRYGQRFDTFPNSQWRSHRRGAIRGAALTDLYNHVPVIVGDSCLANGITRYCSDRIPETLGRGGFLVHPHVEGITDGMYEPGEHLATYQLGDFDGLLDTIDRYLADQTERDRIRRAGREHVMETATYERRMVQLVDLMALEGLL